MRKEEFFGSRTVAGEFLRISVRAEDVCENLECVCITYYTGGLERKRSVYERAVDPVLFPVLFSATIMAFVEKAGEPHSVVRRDPNHLRDV